MKVAIQNTEDPEADCKALISTLGASPEKKVRVGNLIKENPEGKYIKTFDGLKAVCEFVNLSDCISCLLFVKEPVSSTLDKRPLTNRW